MGGAKAIIPRVSDDDIVEGGEQGQQKQAVEETKDK